MEYRVGIVGFGLSAKVFHIPFIQIQEKFELYAIVQRTAKPEDDAAQIHPGVQVYRNATELFADDKVDVVVITTPPNTHYDLAKEALEAGKHVVVEKPFVPNALQAKALRALSKKHDRLLSVYQNRRYDTDFVTLAYHVKKHLFGYEGIREFHSSMDRFSPGSSRVEWKSALTVEEGGGLIYDLGTHLFDQAYYLFGIPERVYASFTYGNRLDSRETDPRHLATGFHAILYYPSTTAHISSDKLSIMKPQRRFLVRGDNATYVKYGADPQEDQLKAGREINSTVFGEDDPSIYPTIFSIDASNRKESLTSETKITPLKPVTYGKYYDELYKALMFGNQRGYRNVKAPVTATEAKHVLRIIEAVIASADERATVYLDTKSGKRLNCEFIPPAYSAAAKNSAASKPNENDEKAEKGQTDATSNEPKTDSKEGEEKPASPKTADVTARAARDLAMVGDENAESESEWELPIKSATFPDTGNEDSLQLHFKKIKHQLNFHTK